jgi:DNA replication protein DnaC
MKCTPQAGKRVARFSLESLTATVSRAKVDASIQKVVTRICRADLIVIDDIGHPAHRSGRH